MKCEVIKKCCITIDAGSIVEVDEEQYKYAKDLLKPIKEEKAVVKGKKKAVDVK